jgi:DNA-binding XRE family transcriptional regulator
MRKRTERSSRPDEPGRVLFAARVRAGRAVPGWTQTALCKKTSITQRAVHGIEAGAVQSRIATVVRVDKTFNEAGLKFQIEPDAFTMTVPLRVLSKHGLGPAQWETGLNLHCVGQRVVDEMGIPLSCTRLGRWFCSAARVSINVVELAK